MVGATLGSMTLKEHIHQLVDSLADDDDRLQAAEQVLERNGAANGNGDSNGQVELKGLVNPLDDPWKDVVPMTGDTSDLASLTEDMTEADWEEQRAHWSQAHAQLIAEGAEPGKYIAKLRAEAALEDAQAATASE
jgi:hypothetical protein